MADETPTGRPQRCVYVIDDDSDIRKSLHFLLATSDINVWPFAMAIDFIDQLTSLAPAPILLDIRMPDIDGLQCLQILEQRGIAWPVIVITAHGDITTAVRAMKLGAVEFLEKPFKPEALDLALDLAFVSLDQTVRMHRIRADSRRRLSRLTPREIEVLSILVKGTMNKIAAHQLGLSVRTVEAYRTNAFAKLDVRSVAEIVALVAAADTGGNMVMPTGKDT